MFFVPFDFEKLCEKVIKLKEIEILLCVLYFAFYEKDNANKHLINVTKLVNRIPVRKLCYLLRNLSLTNLISENAIIL